MSASPLAQSAGTDLVSSLLSLLFNHLKLLIQLSKNAVESVRSNKERKRTEEGEPLERKRCLSYLSR